MSVSNTALELIENVPRALAEDYIKKQNTLSEVLFKRDFSPAAAVSWMQVVKKYLDDDINQEYIVLHNIFSNEFWQLKKESDRLHIKVRDLENRNRTLSSKVSLLVSELDSFMGIKRATRLLGGNIKRKIKNSTK